MRLITQETESIFSFMGYHQHTSGMNLSHTDGHIISPEDAGITTIATIMRNLPRKYAVMPHIRGYKKGNIELSMLPELLYLTE